MLAAIGGPLLTLRFVRFYASQAWPVLPAQLRAVHVNVALNEPKVFEALNHRTGVIRTDVRDYWRAAFFQLRYEGGGDPLIPRCFGNARIDYR